MRGHVLQHVQGGIRVGAERADGRQGGVGVAYNVAQECVGGCGGDVGGGTGGTRALHPPALLGLAIPGRFAVKPQLKYYGRSTK